MTVTLVQPYDPAWPLHFQQIKTFLQSGVVDVDCTIEHVGSTAIPGMMAKPIIDIDIVIAQGTFAKVKERLERLGYVHRGDLGLPKREAFDLVDAEAKARLPEHHLYVCEEGVYELRKHLAFRDFMRHHPEWRETLNRIKRELCVKHNNDLQAYIDGKVAIVEGITKLAMEELQQNHKFSGQDRVTKEDIMAALRQLGLSEGQHVGVHSSLSSFGMVEGGADTVIDALLETVGPEGTVVMPAYSTNREDVELTPRERELGVDYKFKILPFDPKRDSAWTGKISDAFWRRREAIRGSHPSFSLAAIGAKAEMLCQGWKALYEEDGHMLLLGVTLECCSAMHLAEDYVQLPEHLVRRLTPPAELAREAKKKNLDFDMGPYPNFEEMDSTCREHGIMAVSRIGQAAVRFMRLRQLVDLYASYLAKDPDRFYHD